MAPDHATKGHTVPVHAAKSPPIADHVAEETKKQGLKTSRKPFRNESHGNSRQNIDRF